MGCGGSKEASGADEQQQPSRVVGNGAGQGEQHQMTTPGGGAGGEDRSWEGKVASQENPVVFFDMLQGGECRVVFFEMCHLLGAGAGTEVGRGRGGRGGDGGAALHLT